MLFRSLVGFAFAGVLGDDQARHRLQDFADARDRPRVQLLAADLPLAGCGGLQIGGRDRRSAGGDSVVRGIRRTRWQRCGPVAAGGSMARALGRPGALGRRLSRRRHRDRRQLARCDSHGLRFGDRRARCNGCGGKYPPNSTTQHPCPRMIPVTVTRQPHQHKPNPASER